MALPVASSRSAVICSPVNQGTLYPVLLKLEQEGAIASEWGASENNRRARFYRLTRAGHKLLEAETRDWEQTAAIIARFLRGVVNPAAVLSTRTTRQTKIRSRNVTVRSKSKRYGSVLWYEKLIREL
jgi:DNA-binding PadR family transcriptional regulator